MSSVKRWPAACAGLLACIGTFAAPLDPDLRDLEPSGLTAAQAKKVLAVVLEQQHFRMSDPDLWIDGPWSGTQKGTPFRPGYYDFGLVFNNPRGAASNVLGHFAVSISTGDVWETEKCKRYSFPRLTAIQKQITARTGKPLEDVSRARAEIGCG